MATTSTEQVVLEDHPLADRPFPEFVDWLLATLIALAGLALLVGGSALAFVVDRQLLADAIARGEIVSTSFTAAELLEVSLAVVSWTGIGLLVTGIAMVLGAITYVLLRHRAYRGDGPVNAYATNALLGGVTSVVLTFLPFSPAIGGALAGYLERGESERTLSVGALSGLLAAAPLLVILTFVSVGLVSGILAVQQSGIALVVGAAMLLALMVLATVGAGLGGLGGYVGGKLAERTAEN